MLCVEGQYCQYEEFEDNPHLFFCQRTLNLNQIEEFQWRSAGEAAVTRAWEMRSQVNGQGS